MGDNRFYDTQDRQPPEHSESGIGHIFHKVTGAAHSAGTAISEKFHQVSNDPDVHRTVTKGAHVVANIGVNTWNGVKQDGIGVAADVQSGNYGHAALRAAPLLAGPGGLVAKEVLPHALAAGVNELPPEARAHVQSSGAGRLAMDMASRGHLPTSPAGVVHLAVEGTRRSAIEATVSTATGGRINTYDQPQPLPTAVRLAAILPMGKFRTDVHVNANNRGAVYGVPPEMPMSMPQNDAIYSRHAERMPMPTPAAPPLYTQAETFQRRDTRAADVNVHAGLSSLGGTRINVSATVPVRHDAPAAQVNASSGGSSVFPSWMKQPGK